MVLSIALSLDYAAVVHHPQYIGRSGASRTDPRFIGIAAWFTPLTGLYRRVEVIPPVNPNGRVFEEAAFEPNHPQ
jgi:hypothetical protein